ncbi:glycosyltransferase family 32 protein [Kaistia nematophila]|uniref:glycosyltransferase family 32 protein n=1 Tax=Kaistia TaxID=166953 RepID=UPI003B97171C
MPRTRIGPVHQILINRPFNRAPVLPSLVQDNVDRLKQLYPHSPYRLWCHDSLRTDLDALGGDVVSTFDKLRPFAYKADLARLCLLYIYGGLYSDLSLFFLNAFAPPEWAEFSAFQDAPQSGQHWTSTANGILWSIPGRTELELAITAIMANCSLEYYGSSSLHPTGPALLGKAMIKALANDSGDRTRESQWIGKARLLTPGSRTGNLAFFDPHDNLVAVSRKKGGTSLSELGIEGGNDYNTLWNRRTVYGEGRKRQLVKGFMRRFQR